MPLLERATPLGSLTQYAEEARNGTGRLVLVAGEAGVGKTALVEQLQHDLPEARWSWGGCDGLFTPRPLGPLFDIAGQVGGRLLELCRGSATREELFGALLSSIDQPGELNVVVIEDVHWADEATLDLLRFLARRIRDCRVQLIATYRDESLSATDPLRLALGEMATHRSTRRVRIAPLSEDGVRALATGSRLEVAELYRLTSGNPFFVTEVLQAGVGAVPPSARDAVLARAVPLGDAARQTLDAAALIGTRTDLALLESVAGREYVAIDELVATGLLVGEGTSLRFRHEIARLAVAQAIGTHRCALIHGRILAALRAGGCDDDARMAFHAEGAGDAAAVLEFAPAAARRAAELASHREAAAQYERALRFVDDAAPATVAGLCDGLAYELSLADRWQDAADARQRALMLWRSAGDRLREGDTLRRLAQTMWRLCRGREAVGSAEAALAILEPLGPTTELAWAYANLATERMVGAENRQAIEFAQRAQELAQSLGASEVLSDALNTEGCAAFGAGKDWVPTLRRSLQIALSDGHPEQASRAYSNIYSLYCGQRRFAEAERYFVDGIAYCNEHDITTFATCLRGERVTSLERMALWDESVALGIELLGMAGASPINRIAPSTRLGVIRARRDEPGVWEPLDAAIAAAEGTGEPGHIMSVRLARAEAYWLEGEAAAAKREVELADDECANCDSWERGAVAVWLRRVGSVRPGRGVLAEPYQRNLEGDFEGAAHLWTDLGCPFEAAMALGDATEEGLLREALRQGRELGATAFARIVQQKMRQLGIKSVPTGARQTTRDHPLGLTRREREVLDLICAGHTNAEIAARLFISAKTVDHHVSAILAKLGTPTRHAAASQAVRLGLVGAATR
jgi:DNA-binding CsgD family transcriptional regulator/tetratricopeptide (TPR) repeat protein